MPGQEFIEAMVADLTVRWLNCPECGRNTNHDGNGHVCHGSIDLARIADLERALDKAQRVIHSDMCGSTCRMACISARRVLTTGKPT